MTRRRLFLLLVAFVIAFALTCLYVVHEDLPRALRVPSSMLLAPVAIASGLAHLAGLGDVYGNLPLVIAINFVAGLAIVIIADWLWGLRRRRAVEPADPIA